MRNLGSICTLSLLLAFGQISLAQAQAPRITYAQIGVDVQVTALTTSPRIYYPKSDRSITAMCLMPGGKQVLIATRDGLLVCDAEGQVLKRHLLSPPAGRVWTDALRVDGPDAVLDLATAEDGTIWVRSAIGLARVTAAGGMPDHAPSDEAAVELYHAAILATPALQRWFAVDGERVYLPYAGTQAAAYDGKRWSTVASLMPPTHTHR